MVRNPISQFFSLAISIEYIVIVHKESQEIIYYKTAGNFNPDFLDIFRSSIQFDILDLPIEEGEIDQATLEGKYLITRACKMIWVSLILNQRPTLFTREVLKFFCEIFENQYFREISELYTFFQGDISIFRKESKSRQKIDDLIEDSFHLSLTLPFKVGTSKGRKLNPKSKKIFQFSKTIAHKYKGHISLEKLFHQAIVSLKLNNEEIAEIIYELVQKKALLPVPKDQLKKNLLALFKS
ncbi:hypothetical protein LCGC14_0471460 [marine sediment metagenome]|uniref:Uncharacterized protein n=1 Tax=marine sediment metagenome TaxID=412755 RepID=A0A0F9SH94_9ZZZZ|nr:MAG: hypothetical protein Lokiarch_25550 [Candidatus Lokiarchaeum sp. GC14_75]